MRSKTAFRRVIGLALLLTLLLAGCAKAAPAPTAAPPAEIPTPDPEPTVEPTLTPAPTPTPTPDPLAKDLETVRGLISEGRGYAAFQELLKLEERCRGDEQGTQQCEALFQELDKYLRDIEPASGTELVRSFTVQGGCVLEISAFSGPTLVAVTDALADPGSVPNAVRFYVRQGERGQINLPAGTYYVGYQVGYRWFGEHDGFGEYFTEGTLDAPLVFDFYMDGNWASNAKYTITL